MSLLAKFCKIIKEKWNHFRTESCLVLRKFKMETEDDCNFFWKTVEMILMSVLNYFVFYMMFEFKTVRLKRFYSKQTIKKTFPKRNIFNFLTWSKFQSLFVGALTIINNFNMCFSTDVKPFSTDFDRFTSLLFNDEKEESRVIKPEDYLVHRGFNKQYKERDQTKFIVT